MPASQDVTDAIDSLSCSAKLIADAITPVAAPGHDAAGGTVISLTEAVMGITAGLFAVAGAIDRLAEAVRERDTG